MRVDQFRCKGAVAVRGLRLNAWQLIQNEPFEVAFALRSVTFFSSGEREWATNDYCGETLLRVDGGYLWPDVVHKSVHVAERDMGTSASKEGMLIVDDGVEVVGRLIDPEHFHVIWALPKSRYRRRDAERMGIALQYAVALCTNQTTALLRHEVRVGKNWRETVSRPEPVQTLGPWLNLLGRGMNVSRDRLWLLTSFFLSESVEARAGRAMFDRAAGAAEARQAHSQELLLGLILEGLLRTIDGEPLAPVSVKGPSGMSSQTAARGSVTGSAAHIWNREQSLKRFRLKYFGRSRTWRELFRLANEASMRLRNPNAHPDWLSNRDSVGEVERSTDDIVYLSWFYGRLILRLAGDQAPSTRRPPAIAQWPGTITAVNMNNPE